MSDRAFVGRTALVTGGTSGIGLATAVELARRGAHVGIIGRDPVRGAEALQALYRTSDGPHVLGTADVADPQTFAQALDALESRLGSPELVFHNAGADCEGRIDEIDLPTWDRILDTNLRSAYLLLHRFLPAMRRMRRGVFVMGASNAGLVARIEDPVYCASKAGMIMLVRSVALDVADQGIRINAVCPGPVQTASLGDAATAAARTPAHRIADPKEIADLVVYLMSDSAAFITGAAIPIDGGKTAGHLPIKGC